jgi:hypothetical protein
MSARLIPVWALPDPHRQSRALESRPSDLGQEEVMIVLILASPPAPEVS